MQPQDGRSLAAVRRPLRWFAAGALLLATLACGGPTYVKRMVETPAGHTQTLGPAQNTAYVAQVAMEHSSASPRTS